MKNRIKRNELSYYHCMSRVVGRQMLLGEAEKEHMRVLIRRIEGFTGVRVLTYALMTNHFHLLLEEPERDEVVGNDLFYERMACLYSEEEMEELEVRWALWREDGYEVLVQQDMQRYRDRMHDISEFMKQLKQRFSRWYNICHDRKGTLWDNRFKSVLVEAGSPLRTVASYIEMNPMRAGLCVEPQEYRFCGFGEAMGGNFCARKGIGTVVESTGLSLDGWDEISSYYLERVLMYEEARNHPEGFARYDDVQEKVRKRIALTDAERLLCRCRYFSDGRIIGGKSFVEGYYEAHRNEFGEQRKTGARKVKGGWKDLFAVRELVDWQ